MFAREHKTSFLAKIVARQSVEYRFAFVGLMVAVSLIATRVSAQFMMPSWSPELTQPMMGGGPCGGSGMGGFGVGPSIFQPMPSMGYCPSFYSPIQPWAQSPYWGSPYADPFAMGWAAQGYMGPFWDAPPQMGSGDYDGGSDSLSLGLDFLSDYSGSSSGTSNWEGSRTSRIVDRAAVASTQPAQGAPKEVKKPVVPMEADFCPTCSAGGGHRSVQVQPKDSEKVPFANLSRAAKGAHLVMNTIYQRCDADELFYEHRMGEATGWQKDGVDKKFNNSGVTYDQYHAKDWFLRSDMKIPADPQGPFASGENIYLKRRYENSCQDMSQTPPVFKVSRENRDPSLFNSKSNQVHLDIFNAGTKEGSLANGKPGFVTIDCSGFISASFASAGLRWSKDGEQVSQSTATMLAGRNKANSCVKTATLTAQESLKSGDILVMNKKGDYGHSLMIDSVGPDPFGIGQFKTESQCDEPNPANFDFTITESGVSGGRQAVKRVKAYDYLPAMGTDTKSHLVNLAVKACHAKFQHQAILAEQPVAGGVAALLRHAGENESGCTYPDNKPPQVAGLGCLCKNCQEKSCVNPKNCAQQCSGGTP